MDEFLKAWTEFQCSGTPHPVEFRVYYNPDTGEILYYTTESHPGKYILVDKDTFHRNRFDWYVKNDKMCPPSVPISKLRPNSDGTACHALDVTIIARTGDKIQYWKNHAYKD